MTINLTATQLTVFWEWLSIFIEDETANDKSRKKLELAVLLELSKRLAGRVIYPKKKNRITLKVSEAIALYNVSNYTSNYVLVPIRNEIHQKYLS